MAAVNSGNTPGISGMCTDFDTNASELNRALADAEILTNGVLTLTKIDGTTFTNSIPYFADFVISGLALTISNVPVNRTLTYTAGTYQINAQVYSIPVGANFQLTAGHPTLARIDILYLTNTNNIIYQTGTPSVNPVQPTPPAGTLLLAAIGVQINATTSLNYTLVTVNTNSSTIAPPALTPGTVTGSHLYWDGLTWSENTFWNVGNSSFDPTARIHTYTDTDSNGVVTTAKLGDSDLERGFYFLVNDALNGYSTQVDITTNSGDETYFQLYNSDSNLSAFTTITSSSSGTTARAINFTDDRGCEIKQSESSNILEANLASKDPLNTNQFIQTLTSTASEIKQGTNISNINQNILLNQISLSQSNATDNSTLIIQENILNHTINDATGVNEFTLDGFLNTNTLSTIDVTGSSQFYQKPKENQLQTDIAPFEYTKIKQGFLIGDRPFTLIESNSNINNGGTTLNITDDVFSLYQNNVATNIIKVINSASDKITLFTQENTTGNKSVIDIFNDNLVLASKEDTLTPLTTAQTTLDYTLGITDSYIDTVTVNNNVSTNLLNGKFSINGGIIKTQRNTAVATNIANNDWMIVSTAALTVTLPAAPDNGRELVFRSVTGTMTINGNGKNIEAAPTQTVTVGNSRTLVFNLALNRWLNI